MYEYFVAGITCYNAHNSHEDFVFSLNDLRYVQQELLNHASNTISLQFALNGYGKLRTLFRNQAIYFNKSSFRLNDN